MDKIVVVLVFISLDWLNDLNKNNLIVKGNEI